MRILIISDLWLPFPGGAERYMRNVSLELVKRGHQVKVLTSYEPAQKETTFELEYKSIPVYEHHHKGWDIIWNTVQSFRPQVVITHHFFAGEFPEIFTVLGLPTVEIIHSRPRSQGSSMAIFNSHYTRNQTWAKPRDMVILPMADPATRADEHGDYIGHIKPIGGKGIMMTYALAKRFPNRKFKILRGEWQGAETMISNTPNVEYMEPVKDIRDFYKHCRLLLMPSEREEAGTVPFEATMNGIPCISSDVMGLPETNRGGIILPISNHHWADGMPLHPDIDSVNRWEAEINKLDNPEYYNRTVENQRQFMASIPYSGLFDELSGKLDDLVLEHRPN